MTATLMDIAPEDLKDTTVTVRGKDIKIVGLELREIVRLMAKHPVLREMLEGKKRDEKKANGKDDDFDVMELIFAAPEVAAEIGAAGCGFRDDEKAVEKFASLTVGEQTRILKAIWEASFEEMARPIIQVMRDLVKSSGVGSRRQNISLPTSRESLRSATTPEMFGATPPSNSPPTPGS